ncbi:hypothetical protein ACQ4PT_068938 [Festuca glaucescens]
MAANQHHYRSLLSLLLLLAAVGLSSGVAAVGASYLIKSTCSAATNSTWRTPYRFCVRTLSADPAAASAKDARGLATAAANITAGNVTSTVVILNELIDSLQNCLTMYKMMNGSVAGAVEDLPAGRVDEAWPKINDASYHPDFCELALMEGGTNKDPMREENVGNRMLIGMSYDLIQLVAKIPPR